MAKKVSRRLQALLEKVEDRDYTPLEALALLKETATAKFAEAAEAHIRLGIDPKYTDQQLRTTVALPKGTGQIIRVAVIARGEKVTEATNAGAVHVMFGKTAFSPEDLLINLKALQESVDRNRPSGAKGRYWRSLYISSTMGPSISIDISALRELKLTDAA
ncbi:MAG: hypothetical protein LW859_05000 [Anabaena sp. 49633_E8]|nr:hypothetical protein [Anabaena sp. 49633_E8]